MIKYVKLKNYRSLVDLEVDLTNKKGTPKKCILIYGENGVGKSNFTQAFFTLSEILKTKSYIDILNNLMEKYQNEHVKGNISEHPSFENIIRENFRDIETIIRQTKTINSSDNMILEFGFKIKRKNILYRLETNDSRIVSEHFTCIIDKNNSVFFDINEKTIKFSHNMFKKEEYFHELKNMIEKYWGKHSLLSILFSEINDKNDGYVKTRICKEIYNFILYIQKISIKVKDGYGIEKGIMGVSNELLGKLEKGQIDINLSNELSKIELLLDTFFTSLYSDIKKVYYKKEIKNGKLQYTLMFKKQIYNKIVDIDFKYESTGTQYLLEIIPFLISSITGHIVIIDEMDSGIHDLLISNILENLYDAIDGQIIITTHNTMLLESNLPKDCIYTFVVDEEANKELVPISDFETRIHQNLNIRKRYLSGMYGGIPSMMDIDFDELIDDMK